MADLIGTGWKFPIKVNSKGGLEWSDGPQRVQDAIWIILSTSLGERIMLPTFGGGTHEYVFQPNSPAMRARLADAVKQALVTWEHRIELEEVLVDEAPEQRTQVLISIKYRLRSTNELFNMVYPLYIEEGIG
jgi:phage baseplate assembly protein W